MRRWTTKESAENYTRTAKQKGLTYWSAMDYLKHIIKQVSEVAKSKWNQVKDKLILIEGWARDGLTNEQIATNLGVSKTTFYKMLNEHSELSELLKKGKEIVDYEVENALLKRALGYEYDESTYEVKYDEKRDKYVEVLTKKVTKQVSPDTTAQIYWLNNRRPKQWRNKQDIDLSDNGISLAEAIQKAYENKAGEK